MIRIRLSYRHPKGPQQRMSRLANVDRVVRPSDIRPSQLLRQAFLASLTIAHRATVKEKMRRM
jgi:hypothetical protein